MTIELNAYKVILLTNYTQRLQQLSVSETETVATKLFIVKALKAIQDESAQVYKTLEGKEGFREIKQKDEQGKDTEIVIGYNFSDSLVKELQETPITLSFNKLDASKLSENSKFTANDILSLSSIVDIDGLI